MKVSRKGEGEINITIDGERLEQVDRFRYLGALITSDGRWQKSRQGRWQKSRQGLVWPSTKGRSC